MSVRAKLAILILVVAIVPLAISAISTTAIHERAFESKLTQLRTLAAKDGAAVLQTMMVSAKRSLAGIMAQIPWSQLNEAERDGALTLVYSQMSNVMGVALFDSQGQIRGQGVFRDNQAPDPVTDSHPEFTSAQMRSLGTMLSSFSAAKTKSWQGRVDPSQANLFTPLAFPLNEAGTGDFVGVAFGLGDICDALTRARPESASIYLRDRNGDVLCSSASKPQGGGELLTATATVGESWTVSVEESALLALAPSQRIRMQTLFWIAVGCLAAIGAALILAQSINGPVSRLARGANAIAGGNLEHRIDITGNDEIAGLSRAFNSMAAEIEKWHSELQERVDERTQELQEAQELLLESKKIAAMSALGAGVAHEINNPLAGVVAMTQVLLSRARKVDDSKLADVLTKVEKEALRIRDIVKRMHALSQKGEEGFSNLDPSAILGSALDALQDEISAAKIRVESKLAKRLPPIFGNHDELREVLLELVRNAIRAMSDVDGELQINVHILGNHLIRFRITDNGSGIAPEMLDKVFEPFFTAKQDWDSKGLGLAVVHRIVTDHHGSIKLTNNKDCGVTATMTLPIAQTRSHLV